MKGNMEQRACDEAVYIIECRGTVRDAARKFGISKSTVHKDISQRLPLFNPLSAGKGGFGGKQGAAAHPGRLGHQKKI